jgi:hypothetical protein
VNEQPVFSSRLLPVVTWAALAVATLSYKALRPLRNFFLILLAIPVSEKWYKRVVEPTRYCIR